MVAAGGLTLLAVAAAALTAFLAVLEEAAVAAVFLEVLAQEALQHRGKEAQAAVVMGQALDMAAAVVVRLLWVYQQLQVLAATAVRELHRL